MTLPRFTSGKVGKLEFHHLNEAFDRIENVDPSMPAGTRQMLGRVILAKILQHSTIGGLKVASFVEVAASSVPPSSYTAVAGGVTSNVGANQFGAPVVTPLSPVDSIVPLLGHVSADGKLYFRECSSPAQIRTGKITSNANISSGKWKYTLTEVVVDSETTGLFVPSGAGSFTAFNGCEEPTDVVATRNIGVGTIHPATSSATRQPIKNDTIALCVLSGASYVFSIPNGYQFACT